MGRGTSIYVAGTGSTLIRLIETVKNKFVPVFNPFPFIPHIVYQT